MPSLDRLTPSYSKLTVSASNHQTICSKSVALPDNTTASLKPLNIFYVWYHELCRRQNTHPLPAITHGSNWHNNQILDFSADRVKIEDWQPIINSLRMDMSLHVICIHSRLAGQKILEYADTEERVKKIKKWFGTICTKYILVNLLKAVSSCLKITPVLTCLEFDGLQITGEYLTMIVKAVLSNKSLKYLSFKGCPILDIGCQEICDALHQMPNIEILNLSNCGLGVQSGEYLAKVIKYQQINRYCESWHSSLRYEDPVVTNMAGIKRLTLNNNPLLGDTGTELILQELVDDLWVRAIDMQHCGITQNLAPRILDLLAYSRSLRIVDFRRNQLLPATLASILEVLKEKRLDQDNDETEYQWCYTSTSLESTSYGSYISLSNTKFNAKSSKVIRNKSSSTSTVKKPLDSNQKVTKEKINITLSTPDNSCLIKAKEQIMQLYEKLKEETKKRETAEKKCEELQKQVDELLFQQKNQMILKEFTNMKQYINKFIAFVKEHGDIEEKEPIILDLQNALKEVHYLSKPYESEDISPKQSVIFNSPVAGSITTIDEQSEESTDPDIKLQHIFQNMLGPSEPDSLEEFADLLNLNLSSTNIKTHQAQNTDRSNDSDSDETLRRLLEELSKDDEGSWVTEDVFTVKSGLISTEVTIPN